MIQLEWDTKGGSLGTIPEGVFYQIPLLAIDADNNDVYYRLIAGALPPGIQLTPRGIIEGTPLNVLTVQGVPMEVDRDVTSKFAVRAYTLADVNGQQIESAIADQTFTITVTGNDLPQFITPAGLVGTFFDGIRVRVPIEFSDKDLESNVTVRLIQGQLPPGLELDSVTGVIEGIIHPLEPVVGFDPSFIAAANGERSPLSDQFNFMSGSWDYPGEWFDVETTESTVDVKNFQFTLAITDGSRTNVRTFAIAVQSIATIKPEDASEYADIVFVDQTGAVRRLPVLDNLAGVIGSTRSANYYAYQFVGIDFDRDSVAFELVLDDSSNSLPPGLTLDADTGWLSGFIPDQGPVEVDYHFAVRLRKVDYPTAVTAPVAFTLKMLPSAETTIVWNTPEDLGTVDNGSVSTLSVEAREIRGLPLQYRLAPGSQLPPGTWLTNSGLISGQIGFTTFSLDRGTTTFDKDHKTSAAETTFDQTYTFTVNAFSPINEPASVFKTFTVRVSNVFNEPYQTLYIKAMPSLEDRALVNQLLQDQDLLPVHELYRAGDPNFGVATHVRYIHATGLRAAELPVYLQALQKSHYRKRLLLGEINWAQARDASGQVLYDVIYSRIIDSMTTADGKNISPAILWPTRIGTSRPVLYPNSLVNMRTQVYETVGQVTPTLPLWMTSKQADGRVLGFIPSWTIAYVKPGRGARIAYNIHQKFGNRLNQVNFTADRYELDCSRTHAWDSQTQTWDYSRVEYQEGALNQDAYDKYLIYPNTTILG